MQLINKYTKQIPQQIYVLEVDRQFLSDLETLLNRDVTIPDALESAGEEESINAFNRLKAFRGYITSLVTNV